MISLAMELLAGSTLVAIVYTIVPYIFCILSAEIVAGRVAVFSMVGYLDNKTLAMKHIWLSC